jgi:hypothetical protein
MIVLFIVGIVLLSYLLIFGAIVGVFLFFIQWLREKLFFKPSSPKNKEKGHTIDHDNHKNSF